MGASPIRAPVAPEDCRERHTVVRKLRHTVLTSSRKNALRVLWEAVSALV